MFSATHLGHHGWLLASDTTRVLVDPLLDDEYSPGFSATVHPPRTIDARKLPPIDAVILSHEHADHLSFPSLAKLDRRVPIALPARSADAMRTVLREMGFRVVDTAPGDAFRLGDLGIAVFGGDPREVQLEDEITNVQILVAHRDGSFFSYVDGWPAEATLAQLEATVGRVGVFVHVNNTMDWSCLEGGRTAGAVDPLDYPARIFAAESSWWRAREAPHVSVVCGPGLAFVGQDAWMNQFLVSDPAPLCAALGALAPSRRFHAPTPGDTFVFSGGDLRRIARAPFVRRRPGAEWPKSRRPRVALIDEFGPACGRRAIDADEWDVVEAGLAELAGYLYGRSLFRALVAMDGADLAGRAARFAMVLRVDAADLAHVAVYDPRARRFEVADEAAPFDAFAVGVEWWASDLARVLDGRMLPQRLLGHMRTWSFAPEPFSPLAAVWRFFDALNRPEAALAFYRARNKTFAAPPSVARGAAKLRKRGA